MVRAVTEGKTHGLTLLPFIKADSDLKHCSAQENSELLFSASKLFLVTCSTWAFKFVHPILKQHKGYVLYASLKPHAMPPAKSDLVL